MVKPRTVHLLLYYALSLFSLEAFFRRATTGTLLSFGLVISLPFALAAAFLLFLLSSLLGTKANRRIALAFLWAAGLVYFSQLIYFRFFRTFYSFYSAGNAGQILEFWRSIGVTVLKNLPWTLLFFLPAILLTLYGSRISPFKNLKNRGRALLATALVLAHLAGLAALFAGGRGSMSAHDLYFANTYPLLSAERLGLLTYMRLDLQRLTTGWTVEAYRPPDEEPDPGEDPGADPEPDPEPEPDIEYNVMNIDFERLIAEESNEAVRKMHQYFSQVPPTAKNEYTGKYAGYNLIFLTAEGYGPFAARQDVTPTLYKMVHEGYHFTNFYTPVWDVSTSDGEYVAMTGLIPKSGVWSFYRSGGNLMPFAMGNQLKELGYKTMAYHNHTYTYYRRHISHPNMGYTYKGVGKGLKIKKQWPPSDLEMMQVTIPEYIGQEPFHAYYMTVSGHLEYSFPANQMASKNRKAVEGLPLSSQARAYLATHIELDRAMEYLLDRLEEAGVAERTLIVMSSDHYPYGLDFKTIDELTGHPVEHQFELYRNHLFLYVPGMKRVSVDKFCSSLDIIPTVSNLLGLEFDSRLLMGRDIFSDAEPLVIFRDHSFITDRGRYNSQTKEFIPSGREPVDDSYLKGIKSAIRNKFFYSAEILDRNYYKLVMKGYSPPEAADPAP